MLLPSLLKSGDQVYQKVINQLYQKMLLLNLLITVLQSSTVQSSHSYTLCWRINLTGTGTGEGGTVADKVSIGSDGHY